jgi:hypothetical protein
VGACSEGGVAHSGAVTVIEQQPEPESDAGVIINMLLLLLLLLHFFSIIYLSLKAMQVLLLFAFCNLNPRSHTERYLSVTLAIT